MERKELESLTVKKEASSESGVISVRLPVRVIKALKAKNLDVSATVKNILLRLADK